MGGGESAHLVAKELDHVVTFRLAMHEHVEADLLLQADDTLDLSIDRRAVASGICSSLAACSP